MPSMQRLLDRAYLLIEDDKIRDAAQVLDVVIHDDPHNIEAWELYMQISGSREGLESLAELVRWNQDLTTREKDEILSYQQYMLNRLEGDGFAENRNPAGSRSALIIIGMIFVLLAVLWVSVPDIRSMTPFYFLMVFIVGLGFWFWKSDPPGRFGGVRSYSYGVSAPQLADNERPEFFFHGPIIKVGPGPDEEEE